MKHSNALERPNRLSLEGKGSKHVLSQLSNFDHILKALHGK